MGNIQLSPSMVRSATFWGNWSMVAAEKLRCVPRPPISAGM